MQTPIILGELGLVEAPDSPAWEFDRDSGASVSRTFRTATFKTAMDNRLPVNAFGTGIYAGLRVVNVKVTAVKGGQGELFWRMAGALTANGLPELPPDTVTCEPAKQEFRLEKHPRYDIISDPFIDAINAAVSASKEEDRAAFSNKVASFAPFNGVNLAQELLVKMKRGETHFVLFVPVYKWTYYTSISPTLDGGGYPQVPYGPLAPPPNWDWLREADNPEWTGSYWKVTRTWQAGLNIDPNLYPVVAS